MRYLIISILAFSSCKSAEDLVFKAHKKDPVEASKTCNDLYYKADSVVRVTEYIKGDTILLPQDTIIVDCADAKNKDKVIPVKCPPSIIVVDTLRDSIYIKEIDRSLTLENAKLKDTLSEKEKQSSKRLLIIIALGSVIGVGLFLKLKSII